MSFTHLHLHTSYSLLDGAGRISEMVKEAKKLGQEAIAITDHGVMYGVVEFFTTCLKVGIKPIIGCEVYVVPGSRFDRMRDDERYHLILLCENDVGYKNLIKIVSAGFTDGFYYGKPRVDYETLNKYHEGIICLTACLAGEVPKALINNDYADAKNRALHLMNIFGKDNFFIEIQNHGIKEEIKIQPDLIRLANDISVPIVATNDVHYTYKTDSFAHECLLCLQTGKKLSDSGRMKYEKEKFYITSEDEMKELFSFCPEAVENTKLVADRCNVHLEFTKSAYGDLVSKIKDDKYKNMIKKCEYHVPAFKIPDGYTNESYLTKLVEDGIKRKYGDTSPEIRKRVDYELSTIIKMGFVDYFLIVWDYIHFAKTHDIPVGPGRGSAVGSIVAYALDITNVDPIQYGLFFERFLNPERVSMPDIDTDFCVIGRNDVIDYVKNQYGKEKVAQIVTFNTLAAKQVLKDMGRVQDVPLPKVTSITNLIASRPYIDKNGKKINKITLDAMLHESIDGFAPIDAEDVVEFRNMYKEDSEMKLMVDTALRLEGIPRQASVHASGVLIAPEDISNFVPFARGKEDDKDANKRAEDSTVLVTEYDMTTLEQLGLLKMDFLGLRNVTAIKDCIEMIKKNKGIDIDLKKIPYDDKNIYKMISSGDTLGIFQLESAGMTSFMTQLKPTVLEDLIAGISLFRPGPMDYIPKYIDGKKNEENISYDTDKLEKILKPTYGCIVYQEQVMQIVQELAGFTLGRADEVRRAMSKKKVDKILAEKKNFIDGNAELDIKGCINNGVSKNVGNKIFDDLTKFAEYAFNKSHAAAYAVLAYQTAYLKYYYKPEFYTSICNSVIFDRDKLAEYVGAVITDNIKILPVDINKSYDEFTVEGDNIRMGFAALKKVGANISYEIISEREENGLYKGFNDAVKRIASRGGNKNAFEALIRCGAFDSFSGNRRQKIEIYPNIIAYTQNMNKNSMEGEMTIFQVMAENGISDVKLEASDEELLDEYRDVEDYSEMEKLLEEKKYTGIYLSGHPLSSYKELIAKKVNAKSIDFKKDDDGQCSITDGTLIKIAGVIDEVKSLTVKKSGEKMAIVTLSDLQGSFDILVFPKKYAEFSDLLFENNILFIEGKFNIDDRDERGKIYVDTIANIDEYIANDKEGKVVVKVNFDDAETFKNSYEKFIKIISTKTYSLKPRDYVEVILRKERKAKVMKQRPIRLNETMLNELYEAFGRINIEVIDEK